MRCLLSLAVVLGLGAASGVRANEPELERAKRIVSGSCFLCHGAAGESSSELSPRLAAQNPEYIAKQLANFKSGERKSTTMGPMAAALTTQDMRALGFYFSEQRSERHAASDGSLAARGRRVYETGNPANGLVPCAGCHGPRGHGTAQLPRLAGQIVSYLETQLRNFDRRERTNDNAIMHAIAAKLSPEEARSVAEYLSTLE